MVPERHRLCGLQMREAGHHRVGVFKRPRHQCILERGQRGIGLVDDVADIQPEIGCDLIVARTGGVQFRSGGNAPGQLGASAVWMHWLRRPSSYVPFGHTQSKRGAHCVTIAFSCAPQWSSMQALHWLPAPPDIWSKHEAAAARGLPPPRLLEQASAATAPAAPTPSHAAILIPSSYAGAPGVIPRCSPDWLACLTSHAV